MKIHNWFANFLNCYLSCDIDAPKHHQLIDFQALLADATPGDVWLIEGRSRVSHVVSMITRSIWTHAALYIGKPSEWFDENCCNKLKEYYQGSFDEPLLIESVLGKGVIVTPASIYAEDHVRVCRPQGLAKTKIKQIIEYSIAHLGIHYDTLQIFDLARFLFPWGIFPRRWRSSLFAFRAGDSTKLTCSLLLAEVFAAIHYPILPTLGKNQNGSFEFIRRNPRLFTPRDFDYSPFFTTLKYPVFKFSKTKPYDQIPWNGKILMNDDGQFFKQG